MSEGVKNINKDNKELDIVMESIFNERNYQYR